MTKTIAQLEMRLENLEKTVERLQVQLAEKADSDADEEEFVDGAEHDFTTTLKPKATHFVPGRIVKGDKKVLRLGLSDEEWAALPLEDDDE